MLSLPNLLTLSRILAVPILVFLLWHPAPWDYAVTFVLYCIVAITDYFDGYLARARGSISRLGQFLDPIADKIMVGIRPGNADGEPKGRRRRTRSFRIGPSSRRSSSSFVRSWSPGLREFLAELKVLVPVSALAKWKTTFQLVALGALILGGAFPAQHWIHVVGIASLWAAALLTLVTGYDYLRVGLRHMD